MCSVVVFEGGCWEADDVVECGILRLTAVYGSPERSAPEQVVPRGVRIVMMQ